MADFKTSFTEFLKIYNNEGFEFLARPRQPLLTHISNMVDEGIEYFCKNSSVKGEYKEIIGTSILYGILFHDIGKLNPYFQYKILRISQEKPIVLPRLPKNIENLSYHSLISAVIAYEFMEFTYNKYLNIDEKNKKLIQSIVITIIVNHHSSSPSKDFSEKYDIYNLDDEFQLDILFQFIESLKNCSYFMIEIFNLFFKYAHGLGILNSEVSSNEFIIEWGNLYSKLKDKYIKKRDEDQEDYVYKFDNISEILDKTFEVSMDSSVLHYCLILYVESLLCDLDIWDARYYNPVSKKTNVRFYDNLENLDSKLIENYVSSPFGEIDDEYQNYTPEIPKSIIQHLRNELFSEVNEYNIQTGKLYVLNSPTGAGKTLTLLNLGHKLAESIYNQYGFYPKIIYALPYVSIGTQVAKQILEIYKKPDEIFSSSLITIDNYLSDDVWQYSDHNENNSNEKIENKIIGDDAKWYITSWRSHYIVTTFVKFYHGLLKPKKSNYLRFHRICNSIILLDEIQCLPIQYWDILRQIHNILKNVFNCSVVLSTATQPAIMEPNEVEIVADKHLKKPLNLENNKEVVEKSKNNTLDSLINRYIIHYFPEMLNLTEFHKKLINFLENNPNLDTMVVLNTRNAVYDTYIAIKNHESFSKSENIFLLSTLIVPDDRVDKLDKIKEILKKRENYKTQDSRIILITTQLIEAGVDISFECVFRDIAPLDSIVQVAGRCNRHNTIDKGIIYIFKIKDDSRQKSELFYNYVYKSLVSLEITEKTLKNGILSNDAIFGNFYEMDEHILRSLFNQYFKSIRERRCTSDLEDLLENLNFRGLSKNFDLISAYENQVLLFIEPMDDKLNILTNIQKNRKISNEFFKYTINIDKKLLKDSKYKKVIKEFKLNRDTNFFYVLKDDRDTCYSYDTGFK